MTRWLLAVLLSALAFAPLPARAGRAEDAARRVRPQLAADLAAADLRFGAPVLLRIFKHEQELEVWVDDGARFRRFRTYPICTFSGAPGPKLRQGDGQAPEGFYSVGAGQLNPYSSYHLSFDLGYPNAYDRALDRTGDALMVHGKCKSVGCYAMTDALMEEIYTLARESLKNGQEAFEVHAFPFRMTEANLARFQGNPNMPFWRTMKQGYDFFEKYRLPPTVAVCEKRYVVNVKIPSNASIRPDGQCPRFQRPVFEPFSPKPFEEQIAEERITAPGPKTRQFADVIVKPPQDAIAAAINADQPAYGLGVGVPVETGSTSALGFSQ